MKYNCELNSINLNSSHGKLLSQIQPGSTVLECGCATGYMTKFMKEELGCTVSIIEYEQAAFDIAKQYAADGICGDLMDTTWIHHFSGKTFDYILFADVLEHVYDPLTVLRHATQFLSENGTILVSLPNIGHNDILLKLFYDHWDYTQTGLLDDTHIHFWGKNNLDSFFDNANLSIVHRDYITIPTFLTEQMNEFSAEYISQLHELLRLRKSGEVYQFIIAARKKDSTNCPSYVPDPLDDVNTFGTSFEPLSSIQEIQHLVQTNNDLKKQVDALEKSLSSILSSKSWKITKPLRELFRIFKH